MVKQVLVDFERFLKYLYVDVVRNALVLFFFCCVVVLATSFRGVLVLYVFVFLACFAVSLFWCLRKPDKPRDLVEGDRWTIFSVSFLGCGSLSACRSLLSLFLNFWTMGFSMKAESRFLIKLFILMFAFIIFGILIEKAHNQEFLGVLYLLAGCGVLLIACGLIAGIDHDLKVIYHVYTDSIIYYNDEAIRRKYEYEKEKNQGSGAYRSWGSA